jgi:glycerophosphoryl diester phosphodiesterase
VEVKCGTEIIPALSHILTGSAKRPQIVVTGFDLHTISAFKVTMPDVPVYWLRGRSSLLPYGREIIVKARANGLDGLNVHHSSLSPRFVKAAQAAGLDLYVWTVDDAQQATVLIAWGVDGITTNRPGQLRRHMERAETYGVARSWTTLESRGFRPPKDRLAL